MGQNGDAVIVHTFLTRATVAVAGSQLLQDLGLDHHAGRTADHLRSLKVPERLRNTHPLGLSPASSQAINQVCAGLAPFRGWPPAKLSATTFTPEATGRDSSRQTRRHYCAAEVLLTGSKLMPCSEYPAARQLCLVAGKVAPFLKFHSVKQHQVLLCVSFALCCGR